MNPRFYITFFRLAGEERRAFEVLVEDDELIQTSIADCADMWRSKMRAVFPDPLQCRQTFLIRTVLISAKGGLKSGYGLDVAAAFALFLCDMVERRVRTLDFEAGYSLRKFRE